MLAMSPETPETKLFLLLTKPAQQPGPSSLYEEIRSLTLNRVSGACEKCATQQHIGTAAYSTSLNHVRFHATYPPTPHIIFTLLD